MAYPEIWLVRHGETEWNLEQRHQGHLDSSLTDRGRQQAVALGKRLRTAVATDRIEQILTSPLGRARDTAEILAATLELDPGRIAVDARLREISWGKWDGMTTGEIDRAFPGERDRRRLGRWAYVPAGGESYAMADERVRDLFDTLSPRHRYLVVGHGAVNRVIRGLCRGLAESEILNLDQPQDAVLHLKEGGEHRLKAGVG